MLFRSLYRPRQDFAAGDLLKGSEDFGFSVPINDFWIRFRLVREDMKKNDSQGLVSEGTYAWDFFKSKQSDEGFRDKGTLANPITLKVGETKTITFVLKDGMSITLKTVISDSTVANRTGSWTFNEGGVGTFQLKGLKAGKTTLSVPYYDRDRVYLSLPVEVTVTGEGTTPTPSPTPNPTPATSADIVAPTNPQQWEIVSGTPDEQGT